MKNDITGDEIRSRVPSKKYRENYDRISRKNVKRPNKIRKPSEHRGRTGR